MSSLAKTEVLIVDDEPALLLGYRIIFEQHGYSVTAVESSVDARAVLCAAPFDVLLCDLGLETPTAGLQLVEWARRQFPAMRCLLMTGYLDDDTARRAELAGAQTVSKPMQVTELLRLVSSDPK